MTDFVLVEIRLVRVKDLDMRRRVLELIRVVVRCKLSRLRDGSYKIGSIPRNLTSVPKEHDQRDVGEDKKGDARFDQINLWSSSPDAHVGSRMVLAGTRAGSVESALKLPVKLPVLTYEDAKTAHERR
jgi:hypothetical protein